MDFSTFRGFDLRERKRKIENAMSLIPPRRAEDIPIITQTPCFFGFGSNPRPREYWEDPAVMLAFQQDGYEAHLRHVQDDAVPYFMPWFGTGVVASAFGCKMQEATGNGDDPAVAEPAVRTIQDLARLKLPDPESDGWMPRVLRFMEYGVRHGEMPVGATDLNSPLCTAAQICGYDKLFCWMYEEPEAVHDLMDMVCEAFTGWVKLQREICGETHGQSHGLIGGYCPGAGVWVSDDDMVSLSPPLYREFVAPRYQKIFETFGGGLLHWCGVGNHQIENILSIRGLTVINNSPMGKYAAFHDLVSAFSGKAAIQIQDEAPLDAPY